MTDDRARTQQIERFARQTAEMLSLMQLDLPVTEWSRLAEDGCDNGDRSVFGRQHAMFVIELPNDPALKETVDSRPIPNGPIRNYRGAGQRDGSVADGRL